MLENTGVGVNVTPLATTMGAVTGLLVTPDRDTLFRGTVQIVWHRGLTHAPLGLCLRPVFGDLR